MKKLKKLLAFVLVIAMLLPSGIVVEAEGTSAKDDVYAGNLVTDATGTYMEYLSETKTFANDITETGTIVDGDDMEWINNLSSATIVIPYKLGENAATNDALMCISGELDGKQYYITPYIYNKSTGTFGVYMRNEAGEEVNNFKYDNYPGTSYFTTNEWHVLVIGFNGSKVGMSVDGKTYKSLWHNNADEELFLTGKDATDWTPTSIRFGAGTKAGNELGKFDGQLGSIRIYNSYFDVESNATIQTIAEPAMLSAGMSVGDADGKLVTDTTGTYMEYLSERKTFESGKNESYGTITNTLDMAWINSLDAATIVIPFKMNSNDDGRAFMSIAGKIVGNNTQYCITPYMYNTRTAGVIYRDDNGQEETGFRWDGWPNNNRTINLNQWYVLVVRLTGTHIQMIFDSANIKTELFQRATNREATVTGKNADKNWTPTSIQFGVGIGTDGRTKNEFDGELGSIRIYNSDISDAVELQKIMDTAKTVASREGKLVTDTTGTYMEFLSETQMFSNDTEEYGTITNEMDLKWVDGLSDATVVIPFRMNSNANGRAFMSIVGRLDNDNTDYYFTPFSYNKGGIGVAFRDSDDGGANTSYQYSTWPTEARLTVNEWHVLVIGIKGSENKIGMNFDGDVNTGLWGKGDNNTHYPSLTGAGGTKNWTPTSIQFGRGINNNGDLQQFDGQLGAIRIYNSYIDITNNSTIQPIVTAAKKVAKEGDKLGEAPKVTSREAVESETKLYKYSDVFTYDYNGKIVPDGDVFDYENQIIFSDTEAWTAIDGSDYKGNAVLQTEIEGASVTQYFKGGRLKIFGNTGSLYGDMQIVIDEGEPITVSTYSTTEEVGQCLYAVDSLAEGEHTVRITAVTNATSNSAKIAVDYFETIALTEAELTIINENNSDVWERFDYNPPHRSIQSMPGVLEFYASVVDANEGRYIESVSGNESTWYSYVEDGHLNRCKIETGGSGKVAKYIFTGRGIRIYGVNGPNATVTIDGNPVTLNGDTASGKMKKWCEITGLENTEHVVTITSTGKCAFDYFEVLKKTSNTVLTAACLDDVDNTVIADANLVGNGVYEDGATVTLEAPILSGKTFLGWYEAEIQVDSNNNSTVIEKGNRISGKTICKVVVEGGDASYVAVYETVDTNATVTLTLPEGVSVNYTVTSKENGTTSETTSESTSYNGPINCQIGDVVTLTALGNGCAGWKNSYGVYVERDAEYTFTVSGNVTGLTPVYNNVTGKLVIFESHYKQEISRKELESSANVTVADIPAIPTRYGYKAAGWIVKDNDEDNSNDITIMGEETLEASVVAKIQELLADSDTVTLVSYYTRDEEQKCTVTVIDGETTTNDYFLSNVVSIQAKGENGKVFSHWIDGEGNIMSYNAVYSFYAVKDVTLEAVYVVEAEKEAPVGITEILKVTKEEETINDTTVDKMTFVSLSTVPEGCKILKAGVVVALEDYLQSLGNAELTDKSAQRVVGDAWTGTTYRYTYSVRKTQGKVICARAYLVYEDADGIHTVYGDVVTDEDAVINTPTE